MGSCVSGCWRVDQVAVTANDEKMADKMQLEEVFIWSAAADAAMQLAEPSRAGHVCNGRVKMPRERFQPYCAQRLPASAPPLVASEAYCAICMQIKTPAEFVGVEPCAHLFCSPCVRQYVSVKIDDNVVLIGCPEPGCRRGVLNPGDFQSLLPRDKFERWCRSVCESMVDNKFYCPYKDCRGLLDGGGSAGGLLVVANCPHCERLFCARCQVPWHDGVDCEDIQSRGEDERARGEMLLSELAAKQKWQRCPQCNIIVERIDGCRLIKCRCGYFFCYICGSPMSVQEHYCYNCQG